MSESVHFDGYTVQISSSCPPAMAAFIRQHRGVLAERKAAWIADLRAAGVKAAHPDDGWVDRAASTVHLAYPQFGGNLAVGDLLALGQPWSATRIVRVVELIAPGPIVAPCVAPGRPWRYRFVAEPRPKGGKR